jgi:hypothetical protein
VNRIPCLFFGSLLVVSDLKGVKGGFVFSFGFFGDPGLAGDLDDGRKFFGDGEGRFFDGDEKGFFGDGVCMFCPGDGVCGITLVEGDVEAGDAILS